MRANFALFGDIAIPNPLEDRPDRWSWVAEADRGTREARPKYYWLNASAADPGSFGMNEPIVSEEQFRRTAEQMQLERLEALST